MKDFKELLKEAVFEEGSIKNSKDLQKLIPKLKVVNSDTLTGDQSTIMNDFVAKMKTLGYKVRKNGDMLMYDKKGEFTIALDWNDSRDKATLVIHN